MIGLNELSHIKEKRSEYSQYLSAHNSRDEDNIQIMVQEEDDSVSSESNHYDRHLIEEDYKYKIYLYKYSHTRSRLRHIEITPSYLRSRNEPLETHREWVSPQFNDSGVFRATLNPTPIFISEFKDNLSIEKMKVEESKREHYNPQIV